MKALKINSNPDVDKVFNKYPPQVNEKLSHLRNLILESAEELVDIDQIEETLKWGEPSYITKKGSTIRIDWKVKAPGQYAIYFKCTSKLVPTFKLVFGEIFKFEGDRAIIFKMDQDVPEEELKKCIKSALLYHDLKKLPFLGL